MPLSEDQLHFEALMNYLKMGNVDTAFEFAFAWIRDGSLSFIDWKKFVAQAGRDMVLREKRNELYRG